MKPGNPYATGPNEVLLALSSDPEQGLSPAEVNNRRKEFGMNELPDFSRISRWQILFAQFKSPIVILLLAAAGVSCFFGDLPDTLAILFVIVVNGAIGYLLESQAMRSMRSLKKLDKIYTYVLRSGERLKIDARELVPGDIVFLDAGDIISADGRIFQSQRLQVNESSLTGESVPVEKDENMVLEAGTVLADRKNMLYKGSAVTKGNATMVVTAIGLGTEIGEISKMVESAQKDEIPLNDKLNAFGKRLIWLTLILIVAFFLTGLIRGREIYEILETAIALAVAAIPEGLPIVATISLAAGMLNLAKKEVIIKKLAAVETRGETDRIITDKTGTLTENRLKVTEIAESGELDDLMLASVLCNNATRDKEGKYQGDPVEVALLEHWEDENPAYFAALNTEWTELEELPFDSELKYMANLYENKEDGRFVSVAKGSPAVITRLAQHLPGGGKMDTNEEEKWLRQTEELASRGLKVLGFAIRFWDEQPDVFNDSLYFSGLVGFLDPARSDVPAAIRDCQSAGIRVIMATGDHPATALAIARQTGMTDGDNEVILHGAELEKLQGDEWETRVKQAAVLSRVTPRQKLDVVSFYQKNGHIVGMTGDGVNDAPALKKSDIGIAMGLRGTQVAEEAADMVLQNDAFTSIVEAIRQGRIIFANIRNFVIYLLSCNLR